MLPQIRRVGEKKLANFYNVGAGSKRGQFRFASFRSVRSDTRAHELWDHCGERSSRNVPALSL